MSEAKDRPSHTWTKDDHPTTAETLERWIQDRYSDSGVCDHPCISDIIMQAIGEAQAPLVKMLEGVAGNGDTCVHTGRCARCHRKTDDDHHCIRTECPRGQWRAWQKENA